MRSLRLRVTLEAADPIIEIIDRDHHDVGTISGMQGRSAWQQSMKRLTKHQEQAATPQPLRSSVPTAFHLFTPCSRFRSHPAPAPTESGSVHENAFHIEQYSDMDLITSECRSSHIVIQLRCVDNSGKLKAFTPHGSRVISRLIDGKFQLRIAAARTLRSKENNKCKPKVDNKKIAETLPQAKTGMLWSIRISVGMLCFTTSQTGCRQKDRFKVTVPDFRTTPVHSSRFELDTVQKIRRKTRDNSSIQRVRFSSEGLRAIGH